eukprot:gnl/MRDRNA2_/MRDRNA2_29707_c0_seq1.p1 gnl/MRDRNA2_/MRDRNA2_29707_c0~~gnl/MRDRNA2_/MRDRNA2_29707_c0_seq1.p1  ORF type:complete len:318 (-),score=66.04 gnl/MRDRNA2_/MRDRNA2_29707_c0_seq1:187-1140(-)
MAWLFSWTSSWCASKPVGFVTLGTIKNFGLNEGKLQETYEVDTKKIGEGAYGMIYKAVHKPTGSMRAVKKMLRELFESDAGFQLEAGIMRSMKHPNIIDFHETFVEDKNIYLVMELCEGGEVLDRIAKTKGGRLSEREVAIFMKQVFEAIEYMHASGICHRDLKLENFLFKTMEPVEKNTVKLIDFGVARQFSSGAHMKTVTGTLSYTAPEVMNGYYTQSCDMWSCGVIMFILLVGIPPFHGETDAAIVKRIKAVDFNFKHSNWKGISEDAKDLVTKLLNRDPQARCTATEALATAWVKNTAPNAKGTYHKSPAAGG